MIEEREVRAKLSTIKGVKSTRRTDSKIGFYTLYYHYEYKDHADLIDTRTRAIEQLVKLDTDNPIFVRASYHPVLREGEKAIRETLLTVRVFERTDNANKYILEKMCRGRGWWGVRKP